jgi:hypothetical protein
MFPKGPEGHHMTRRGRKLFQIAMEMANDAETEGDAAGPAALFYFTNAIAYTAAQSDKPRQALEHVIQLFDLLDTEALAKEPPPIASSKGALLADLALELSIHKEPANEMKGIATRALRHLVEAIIRIAAFNANSRQIIERVVHLLDNADVEAARRDVLK